MASSWIICALSLSSFLLVIQCQLTSSSSSSLSSSHSSIEDLYDTFKDIEATATRMSLDPAFNNKEASGVVRLYHIINLGKDKYKMSMSPKLRQEYSHLMAQGRNHDFIMYYKVDDLAVGREMLLLFTNQVVGPTAPLSLDQPAGASKLKKEICSSIVANRPNVQCVVSFKSMYEAVVSRMGPNVTLLATPPAIPQFYRVQDQIKILRSEFQRVTVCHRQMVTALTVYTCHSVPRTQVQIVPLAAVENGMKVQAVSICHLDTTWWNPKFHAFILLNVRPGTSVCHFLSTDDLVWVN